MKKTQTVPKPTPPKNDLRYEPTKAELNEDMRINATPEALAETIFSRSRAADVRRDA